MSQTEIEEMKADVIGAVITDVTASNFSVELKLSNGKSIVFAMLPEGSDVYIEG